MPLSATASVGDNTAASANATGSGMAGIITCRNQPSAPTVMNTRPEREQQDRAALHEKFAFRDAPAVGEQKRRDEEHHEKLGIERDVQAEASATRDTRRSRSGSAATAA